MPNMNLFTKIQTFSPRHAGGSIYVYICVHLCMCVCVHIYIYTHRHTVSVHVKSVRLYTIHVDGCVCLPGLRHPPHCAHAPRLVHCASRIPATPTPHANLPPPKKTNRAPHPTRSTHAPHTPRPTPFSRPQAHALLDLPAAPLQFSAKRRSIEIS
jgi:hypothetical protein